MGAGRRVGRGGCWAAAVFTGELSAPVRLDLRRARKLQFLTLRDPDQIFSLLVPFGKTTPHM